MCFDICFVIEENLMFFFVCLHRLVGLRLLRLCPFLVSEVEQEIYSARDSVPRPCNGFHPLTLTRGVPLDLLLASLGGCFYFVLVLNSVWLCHSSFLTPHSISFSSLSLLQTPLTALLTQANLSAMTAIFPLTHMVLPTRTQALL